MNIMNMFLEHYIKHLGYTKHYEHVLWECLYQTFNWLKLP